MQKKPSHIKHYLKSKTPESLKRLMLKNNVDKQLFESYLHQKFNVKDSSIFYNKVNQTPVGFDCTGHTYNLGRTPSEETKIKLSNSLKGRIISEEAKEKMRSNALNRTKEENLLLAAPDQAGYCVGTSDRSHLGAPTRLGAEHLQDARLGVLFDLGPDRWPVLPHTKVCPLDVRFHLDLRQ
jgi:hypothetical protein